MTTFAYVQLLPTGMHPCSLDKAAYSEAVQTWLCTGCAAPKPGIGTVNVQLEVDCPGDYPLTFVNGCGVILAHRDLLAELGATEVQADLILGTVTGPSGNIIPDWATVRGRHRLIVRGSSNVSYRRCELCGRQIYFAMGTHYLYPKPPSGVAIFESDLSLVVCSDVFKGARKHWTKLEVKELPVLDQPLDGLDDLVL